jgi:hypothetical protein
MSCVITMVRRFLASKNGSRVVGSAMRLAPILVVIVKLSRGSGA